MTPHDDAHWGEGRYMSHAAAERKVAEARSWARMWFWQGFVGGMWAGVIFGLLMVWRAG